MLSNMGNEYYIQKKYWKKVEDELITIRDSGNLKKIRGALSVSLGLDENGKER
mgnify:FL=1